ncbi:MAG: patatin-like phospholipase family protein [Ignavibacteriales bacterium]
MKRALVLSGGGSRGAYQIGVWKALRELNIKYDIITGTSVGALNGAFMVQDNFEEVMEFWSNINFKEVFNDTFFEKENLNKRKVIGKYLNDAFFKQGLEIKALEQNLDKYLNEELFFNSSIDYGTVIYDFDNKRPLMIKKSDMEHNKLRDYVIASATLFPIFKKKKINDNYYVDGGYYDNLPINLAIDMGATEIIAVYTGVFGKRKPVKDKNIKITYIVPKSRLGFPAFFDKKVAQRNLKLGYNDTMKVYKKHEGNIYTFKDKELSNFYYENKDYIKQMLLKIFKHQSNTPYKLRGKNNEFDITLKEFINSIEFIAYLLNVDESRIYTMEKFNEIIIEKYRKLDINFKKNFLSRWKMRIFKLRSCVARKIYLKLNDIENNRNKVYRTSIIYPKTLMGAIYLYIILEKNNWNFL